MSIRLLLLLFLLAPTLARADHPLISEDTGVVGKGVWEFEAHGDVVRKGRDFGEVVLAHGIAAKVDLEVGLPFVDGEGTLDPVLALKWRFHEAGPFSLAAKPALSDQFWALTLAAAYEIGAVELVGDLSYLRNREDGERESLWRASASLLWAWTEKLKLVFGLAHDTLAEISGGDRTLREAAFGVAYAFTGNLDLGAGVRHARSDAADDTSLMLGMKLRW